MAKPCLILLEGDTWDSRRRAVSVALTAAAFGHPVVLALSGGALRAWVERRFDEGAPSEEAASRVGTLSTLVDEAREALGVEVVACATEIELAGLEVGAARPRLDAVRSLPEQWRFAAEGHVLPF